MYYYVVCRLKNEGKVTELLERVQKYIEDRAQPNKDSELCRIYMRRIEHLYYKVYMCTRVITQLDRQCHKLF